MPKVTTLANRVRPFSLGRGHEIPIARSAPEGSWASPIEPCVSDLGTVCLASKRPPPLRKPTDGENTSVIEEKPLPSHIAEARGRLRIGLPSRSMIKQLFFAYASSLTQELCFTCGSTTFEAASTSIHSAGTKPLLQKQELVFLLTLSTLEQVLGFVVWDCIDHDARPDLVERIVTNRSTSDTAVIQRDMEEPRHRTLRPAGPRNRCQQRSAHGVVLPLLVKRKCCLMMDTSQPFPNQLHHSGWPRGPNEQTRRPTDTLSASLLPVRGVERESASVKQDTHDPHGTTNPHPGTPVMELLEVQPPGSAHARAKKFFEVVP